MVISTSVYNRGVLSFENYRDLLSPFNLGLIRNSVFVATLSSLLGTFFAFCVALHAFFQKRKWGELIYRSLMITMISPPFISAIALIMLFGRRGLITHGILGLSANPYGWQGIVLLQTLSQISLASIMLISALNSIDSRLIQASRDLGANPTQTVFRVILPSIFPAIMSVLFLFFTMNMADFGTPIIIGGNFNVLAAEAYLKTFSAHDIGKAATLSVLLIPPAIVAFYFYRKNIGKINTLSEGARVLKGAELNFRLPLVIKAFIGGVTGVFFFCMILKYGNIFLAATTTNVSGELVFTWNHIEAFHYRYVDALYRSLHMSIIAGLLSSVIGILLSYYTHRLKLPLMKPVEFIASLPYIIPGLFFGLGYIVAFHNEPLLLTGTMAILVLNCTFRHISVGNKAANAAFENIDSKLEMAARDLGTSRIGVLVNVIFPLFMDKGDTIQVGTPKEIYFSPKSDYVASFIGKSNIIKGVNGERTIIRPEDIKIDLDDNGEYKIESLTFLGQQTELKISNGDISLEVTALGKDNSNFITGDRVNATINHQVKI